MAKATSSRSDRMVSSVPLILQATLTERTPRRLIPTGWHNHVSSAFLLWFSVYWPLCCSSLWFPEDFEAPSVGDWRRWTETSPWGSLLFRVILFLQVCLRYAYWSPIQHSSGQHCNGISIHHDNTLLIFLGLNVAPFKECVTWSLALCAFCFPAGKGNKDSQSLVSLANVQEPS